MDFKIRRYDMATVKIVLRTNKNPNSNGEHPVHLRLTHQRKVRYISLPFKFQSKHWMKGDMRLKTSHPRYAQYNVELNRIYQEARQKIDFHLVDRPGASIDQLRELLDQKRKEVDFISFGRDMVQSLHDQSKIRYGNRCGYVIDKLEDFSNGHLPFKDMDVAFLRRFKTYLIKEKKNSVNTTHGNFKVMKTFYRQAIAEGYASQGDNPFFLFSMGTETVHKDHLELAHVKALMNLDFSDKLTSEVYKLTRDSFMLSFWCAGIRFSDISNLKWSNITNGETLTYVMGKTKERKSIELSPPAVAILDDYRGKVKAIDGYVLPWITGSFESEKELIKLISQANARANKALKILAKEIGFSGNLTFHTSRHSFTSIADEVADLSVKELQSLLGHSDSRTTEIYRDSLSTGKDKKAMTKFYEAMKNTGV